MPLPSEPKQEKTKLSKKDLIRIMGDSGTERYSGFFFEEPNVEFRDDQRVDIIEEMRRTDGAVKATLNAIKTPMLSTEWFVECEDDDVKQFVEDSLFNMKNRTWKEFLREALAYLDFGHYVFEKIYEIKDGRIILKDLEPRIPNSILQWQLSDGRRGIVQLIRTDEVDHSEVEAEIPEEKLLIFTNDKEGDDITGQPIIRAAYKHYTFKDTLYRIQGIAAERFGVGVPTVILPNNFSPEDKDEAEEMVKNLRSNEKGYIVLPSSEYEIKILTPDGNPQGSAISDAISHHNKMIMTTILAQFLGLGSDSTGSFALSKDQSSFFLKHVEDKARYVAEQVTNQVIDELVRLNFGNDAPRAHLSFVPLGDYDLQEFAEALSKLVQSGLVHVDDDLIRYTHKTFKLPNPPEKEEQQEKVKDKENIKDEAVSDTKLQEVCLNEKDFSLRRKLTTFEEDVDFRALNEDFNELQVTVEQQVAELTAQEAQRYLEKIQKLIEVGDIAGIASVSMRILTKLQKLIDDVVKDSFERGKKSAASEIEVSVPSTPSQASQMRRLEANEVAEHYVGALETSTKASVRNGLATGAAIAAIVASARDRLFKESSKMITNISGTLPGQYLNRGRSLVFNKNVTKITKYQRSEILDSRTCNMCMTLDKRIVKADEPIAQMDLVHNHCRGVWVPIMQVEDQPKLNPIPKSALNKFDLVDGRPVINAFEQLKKPINKANKDVQEEIEKRLKE